jgi:hypothetical protein
MPDGAKPVNHEQVRAIPETCGGQTDPLRSGITFKIQTVTKRVGVFKSTVALCGGAHLLELGDGGICRVDVGGE